MFHVLNAGAAFALGAMHALEPGHGKTAIASYTIGNRNAKKHLFTLVFSMAFSHTITLVVIGITIGYLFPFFDSGETEYIIGVVSPIILISIGLYMLFKIKKNQHVCGPGCSHHDSKLIQHNDKHKLDNLNLHSVKLQNEVHSKKTTILIGFLTGLVPCPSAVAAFFIAGQSGSLSQSLGYVLIYVLGFVMVMLCLTVFFSYIGDSLSKKQNKFKLLGKLDKVSALMIVLVGFSYLVYNLFFHHHQH